MFKFKSFSLRGSWNLNVINEECPICRNNVLEQCSDCNNDQNIECISVIGKCSHVYHLHCIDKWLKKNNSCPLDNSKWEFKRPEQFCRLSNMDLSGNIINIFNTLDPSGNIINTFNTLDPSGNIINTLDPSGNIINTLDPSGNIINNNFINN